VWFEQAVPAFAFAKLLSRRSEVRIGERGKDTVVFSLNGFF